ncbi:ATP-binding protein [Tundrisphaera sp. TA3]|uniref:ATP-binding protein n=1 Tax=Tundrisphaera sp. TA3 TaxID=3435775 RepID=UPI003EB838B8
MGERTRSFDWGRTPLGPIEGWPQALKTVVRVMLSSRYAMWLGWGPEFTFFYNDDYARMTLGPKHPWALGRPAGEVWSEIWGDIGPRAERVVRTGQATWDEGLLLFLERNGFAEETYHTFSYSPVPDDHGAIGGMLCVVTEDTERTIGERRLRTLRELAADTSHEPRSVEEACRAMARLLEGNPHDVPFALLYLLDDGGTRLKLAGSAGLGPGSAVSPHSINLADGRSPWPFREAARTGAVIEVADLPDRFGPMPGGAWLEPAPRALILPMARPGQSQVAGFVVAGISPRRPLDDGYRGFLDLLAGQVANAVNHARAYEEERERAEKLAELDRAKTAFFSNVSHEFRTPLTLMLGPVEDLLAADSGLPPGSRGLLEVVNRNGLRLLRLVNTLLDFSRIEAGRVRACYRPTDIAALTADLASVFRSACERAGLGLVVDCPPIPEPAYLDAELWEKVVLNLLSNAFKFTFEGEIAVALRRVGRSVELSVRDTGAGIPEAEMPRLFERFHRVESARGRTHEGSGIGLALVQEVVKLHGGAVAAESVVGQGTTFRVTIPLGSRHLPAGQVREDRAAPAAAAAAVPFVEEALRWLPDRPRGDRGPSGSPDVDGAPAEPDPPSPQAPAAARPRVLLADDNADMRDYVARLLSGQFRVEAVADGEAALASALASPPDLILTDVMMPRLDGFGLLRALRDDARTAEVPILMLSARAGEESRVEGMEAGADDYLVKPFGARELLARVAAHLQMARMRREAGESLRHSNARFEAVLDAAPIGVFLVDSGLRIRQVNPTARPAFGEIPGLIGRDLDGVLHAIWPDGFADEAVARFRATLATGRPHLVAEEALVRRGSGEAEYFEWQIHRLPLAGGEFGVVCYFTDISRHVRARQALAEADGRKNEFLAILAHELRNPLAPIRNGLQIMKRAGDDRGAIDEARVLMERQVSHMVRLIDDLMDVSRITRGKLELRRERADLATIIGNAVDACRPLVDSAGHELSVSLPPRPIWVRGDATRLAQVFTNLLNNAAKYTEPGGHLRLAAEQSDREVVVAVSDDGLGIPAEMLPQVFDMFTQVDRSLERAQGGLGIGLTLVRRIVEKHGGSIEARSQGPGRGSEFVVRLPIVIDRGGDPSAPAGRIPESLPAPRRILVVDDNLDAARTLGRLLKLMGHAFRLAHDGGQAVEVAGSYRPEILLLDIGLPVMNGYEVAREIRSRPWGREIHIIALTGWGQEDDRRRSHEAGIDWHLVKPVDPDRLEALLRECRPLPA